MPAAAVARPARAVPDTARHQPQASHIDLTERNQFAVTKPAPHRSSNHAMSLDPEDTTTNPRQARSITERQWGSHAEDRHKPLPHIAPLTIALK